MTADEGEADPDHPPPAHVSPRSPVPPVSISRLLWLRRQVQGTIPVLSGYGQVGFQVGPVSRKEGVGLPSTKASVTAYPRKRLL